MKIELKDYKLSELEQELIRKKKSKLEKATVSDIETELTRRAIERTVRENKGIVNG